MISSSARGVHGRGGLAADALVRIGAGVMTFLAGADSVTGVLAVISVWAILSAVTGLIVVAALRKELTGEWPLPLSAVLALLLGFALMLRPTQYAQVLAFFFGIYAISYGALMLAFASRMRQLAREMLRA
jgi:uncharacterized membrane protein HdeD (DUF308 family)